MNLFLNTILQNKQVNPQECLQLGSKMPNDAMETVAKILEQVNFSTYTIYCNDETQPRFVKLAEESSPTLQRVWNQKEECSSKVMRMELKDTLVVQCLPGKLAMQTQWTRNAITYHITAVMIHRNGHYFTYGMRENQWFELNDNKDPQQTDWIKMSSNVSKYAVGCLLEQHPDTSDLKAFGLQNHGSTCYQNAALQFLFTSIQFRKHIAQEAKLQEAKLQATETNATKTNAIETKQQRLTKIAILTHVQRNRVCLCQAMTSNKTPCKRCVKPPARYCHQHSLEHH